MKLVLLFMLLPMGFMACSSGSNNSDSGSVTARAQVQVQSIKTGAIEDSVRLSARAYFLKKNVVSVPFNAYVLESDVTPGVYVAKGQDLFTIQTKEARALNTSQENKNLGTIELRAPAAGQVISILHYAGDYVKEGATLAIIVRPDDVYFKLFVPFQYRAYIKKNKLIPIELPNGERLLAQVIGSLSQADGSSQTAVYLLKPRYNRLLPEGLQASAYPSLQQKKNTQIVPKEAVLANETLDTFWVMKIVDDSLAVKVPVKKGIETSREIEILDPQFEKTDPIIISGQYGLEDSSLVQVIQTKGVSQ